MTIHVLCIDPESGKYRAHFQDRPHIFAIEACGGGRAAAVGELLMKHGHMFDVKVIDLDEPTT